MDSLTREQRLVVLELLAAQHPEYPRHFWISLADFYERNPFSNPPTVLMLALQVLEQSPHITFEIDEKKFLEGAIENMKITLTRRHPIRVGGNIIWLDIGKSIDPIALIVLNSKPGDDDYHEMLNFAPIPINNDALAALKPVFEALEELWSYEYSAAYVATRFMKNKPLPPPSAGITIALTKIDPHKMPNKIVEISKTQLAFMKRLAAPVKFVIRGSSEPRGRKKLDHCMLRDQYNSFLQDLADDNYVIINGPMAFIAFVLDDTELMDKAIATRDFSHARFLINVAKTRDRNVQLMTLGLFRKFAGELELPHDANTSTPFAFLASMNDRDRLTLTERVAMHEKLMESMVYNNCPHKRLRIKGPPSEFVRENYFGEVSDDVVLCKKCHLPFMCIHVIGIPAANYMRRVGRNTLCKYCGEILQERLLDDINEETVIDEDFQRLLWARLQAIKERILIGNNDRNDRKILGFISKPLYTQYSSIERMRSMRAELREILQRFYIDVFIIVTLGMMKYRLRDINSIDSIVDFLMKNSSDITMMQMDDKRIRATISTASKVLSDRLNDVSDAVEINSSIVAINNSIIYRQLMTGNLASNEMFVRDLADESLVKLIGKRFDDFRREQDMSFVTANIHRFPAQLQPFVMWMIGNGPLENPPDMIERYKKNLAAERNRPFRRRIGTAAGPKITWKFWWPGPVDFTIEPTKVYVFKDAAGKLVDVPAKDVKNREPGMTFVDYRRADGKLLREEWWKIGYESVYDRIAKSGRGFKLSHVSQESSEKARELRRKVTHDLFIEAYERICPAARQLSLHEFDDNNKCTICKATYEEITTSIDYFARYETVFSTINVRELSTDRVNYRYEYIDPPREIIDAAGKFDDTIAKMQSVVNVELEYWQQLGNFIGRTVETTIQMTRDGICPVNHSRHRYGIIVGYIRDVFRAVGYITNIENGAIFKHPILYEIARKKSASPALRKYYEIIAGKIGPLDGEPVFDPARGAMYINGAISLLCDILIGLHAVDGDLGAFLAKNIIDADTVTAVYSKLDFLTVYDSNEDYKNDADYQALELRSRREEDPFFQDFDFEGGDENIAPRD